MAESSPNGVENTKGKGEIACYKQYLFFPHGFQNILQTCKNQNLFGRVKVRHTDSQEQM